MMMKLTFLTLTVALLLPLGAANAQGLTELPEICTADYAAVTNSTTMGGMHPATKPAGNQPGMDMSTMDQAHKDLMMGMDAMDKNMMMGMMAKDIDVAFVCSMLPHHQGAIDMAKAELLHGKDAWAKEMAQKVIDAQEQEIADMLAWLEERPN